MTLHSDPAKRQRQQANRKSGTVKQPCDVTPVQPLRDKACVPTERYVPSEEDWFNADKRNCCG